MKNLKKITLTLLFLVFTTILNAQNYDVPEGFRWTDKDEYLYISQDKEDAIQKCMQAFSMHGTIDIENDKIYMNSNIPIFWTTIDKSSRNMGMVFYCIKYKDDYDVIIKRVKNKDTYLFSVKERNGEYLDLFYLKQ